MDLSFTRFEHDAPLAILPPDLAVMMVGIAARQVASPTARCQFELQALPASGIFAPAHGTFNAAVAASLRCWWAEVNAPFTEPL